MKLERSATGMKTCPNCGMQNSSGATRCSGCGKTMPLGPYR